MSRGTETVNGNTWARAVSQEVRAVLQDVCARGQNA